MGGRRWTREEEKILRSEWAEMSGRTLRKKLPGRTACAIAMHGAKLGLPCQSQGKHSISGAARVLGFDYDSTARFISEVGARADALVPVPVTRRRTPKRAAPDVEILGVLLHQRDTRTMPARTWDKARGHTPDVTRRRLRNVGLSIGVSQGQTGRLPEGLLAELEAAGFGRRGDGPWARLWREVLALADRPCAPWLLALAAWDLRQDPATEWVEAMPQGPLVAARRLAGLVVPRAGTVRCGDVAAQREERAA